MISTLILGFPSTGKVHDRLQDQILAIFMACAESLSADSGGIVLPGGQRRGVRYGGRVSTYSSDIAFNRNRLLAAALMAPNRPDWLLQCDSDNWTLDGKAVVRMILDGERHGAAVIAAPVRRRDGVETYNFQSVKGTNSTDRSWEGKLENVDRVGTAFQAINLRWVRDHWSEGPWFAFEQTFVDGKPDHVGEDWVFCDGVRSRNGTIVVDGRFEPQHEGCSWRAFS